MPTNSQAVHVGLNYLKAMDAKKEILLTETSLIQIVKKMRSYSALRKKEFILKNKLKKALTNIRKSAMKIEQEFPDKEEVKVPKKRTSTQNTEQRMQKISRKSFETTEKLTQKKKDRELERELEEIQEKLAKLA
jgi:hypothetical protein